MSTATSLRTALWLGIGLAGSVSCTGAKSPDSEVTADTGRRASTGFGAGVCAAPETLLQVTDAGGGSYRLRPLRQRRRTSGERRAADWPSDATGACTWDDVTPITCGSDACDNASGEYCNHRPTGWEEDCRCDTTCRTDSDCDAGEACYPDGVATTPALRSELAQVFRDALTAPDDGPSIGIAGLEGCGLLSPPLRHELLEEGRREVIAPLAEALLGTDDVAASIACSVSPRGSCRTPGPSGTSARCRRRPARRTRRGPAPWGRPPGSWPSRSTPP